MVTTVVVTISSFAADTAYSALRLLGKKYGEETLERIYEVRGGGGKWEIIFADVQVTTGFREVEVAGARIGTESAVAAPQATAPINLNQLNLDSDGALLAVNQEIQRNLAERRAHFTLATAPGVNIPVWTIELRNRPSGEVSQMQIAADTGSVLSTAVAPPPVQMDPISPDGDVHRDQNDLEAVAESGMAGPQEAEENPAKEKKVTKKQTRSRAFRGSPDVIIGRVTKEVERGGRQLRRFLPF